MRQEEVKSQLETQPADKSLLHPVMASRFHESVKDLANVLNQDDARSEASEHLRGLVYKVVLIPPKGGENDLRIDLCGDLAGILNMAAPGKNTKNLASMPWVVRSICIVILVYLS